MGNSAAQMAAAATVQITMEMPAETCCSRGTQVNRLLNPGLETVYLRSDDSALSSSMVRELMAFGKDVSAFVPAPVLQAIKM